MPPYFFAHPVSFRWKMASAPTSDRRLPTKGKPRGPGKLGLLPPLLDGKGTFRFKMTARNL
ncbi:hypothetical protein RvY_13839 [Ramazzottius varieornatus]|uniref:Uncharacterized protein n=1 Tax=Ramazzottius varieornatus TaxID=947166 RepID=A0A1D1VP96_RAMVA|nr:hypothetical protein RvY_13839 [Ramazzottius varieornatus]